MADDQDPSSKTEEPTGKRLDDAQRKGNIARSMEVNHWFLFLGAIVVLLLLAESMMRVLARHLLPFLSAPHAIRVDQGALSQLFVSLGGGIGGALLPIFLLLGLLAIAASLVQNKPAIAWDKIAPDWSRVSLSAGVKRQFSLRALIEFAKSLLKISIIGAIGLMLIWPEAKTLPQLITVDVVGLLRRMGDLALMLLGAVLAVMTLIAAADLFYQKLSHLRQLRMTRHEVKDELRQTEGDPAIKARLRLLRMERARKRMMAAVPTADVVVTNPTHFAVALKYDPDSMAAPRVVAKGADLMAQKIRKIANDNQVPIVENAPLARALYAIELGHEVTPQHYHAVAEIIGYVMRLKGKIAGAATPPQARPNGPAPGTR